MNLPILIQHLYGQFSFTGLYSFEFVDKNRNTITEIFFMTPPKNKSVTEQTRSTTVPTLGSNYNLDAGNATKSIVISGDLYFPYVGSPDNPISKDNTGLNNKIDGLTELMKLQWMLIRYRDYTMTRNSKIIAPAAVIAKSKEANTLYKKTSKLLKEKVGALYDEIQLIVHDYDMDDHYYCRVEDFTIDQSSEKYIVGNYSITIECYERDTIQSQNTPPQIKKTSNEETDNINTQLQNINFEETLDSIQAEIGYNSSFLSSVTSIGTYIEQINEENNLIQAGNNTVLDSMPILMTNLLNTTNNSLDFFIDTFLSPDQKVSYEAGDITIDDIVNIDLLNFYNSLQKIRITSESLSGTINSIVQQEDIRYYENADDYTLTEEQFDSSSSNKVENDTNFFFYEVQDGDTSRIIAQRKLNDQEKYISILKINNISENDFIENTLIGQKIKIPFNTNLISNGSDNLVYESDFNNIDAFLYGKDIKTDINNNLIISESGDISGLTGIDNVFNNIESRIKNLKGSLNVFNPNWGTIAIDDGNAPLVVKIDRYLTDVIFQIQDDPRVESVQIDLDTLKFEGEALSASFKIFFIGTSESREVTL